MEESQGATGNTAPSFPPPSSLILKMPFFLFFLPPLPRYPLSFHSTSLPLFPHLILLLTSHVDRLNYNACYDFFLINPSFSLCLGAFPPCWVSLLSLSPSLPCPTLGLFLPECALVFLWYFFVESFSKLTYFPKLIWLIPLTNHNRFF